MGYEYVVSSPVRAAARTVAAAVFVLLLGWIYRCAESACPVFWKSPVRKEGITVPDKIMNAAETPS